MAARKSVVFCVLAALVVTIGQAARKQSPLLEDNAVPKKLPYRVTGMYTHVVVSEYTRGFGERHPPSPSSAFL